MFKRGGLGGGGLRFILLCEVAGWFCIFDCFCLGFVLLKLTLLPIKVVPGAFGCLLLLTFAASA